MQWQSEVQFLVHHHQANSQVENKTVMAHAMTKISGYCDISINLSLKNIWNWKVTLSLEIGVAKQADQLCQDMSWEQLISFI